MAQESETHQQALRRYLISSVGIQTAEEFFRLENTRIKNSLMRLATEMKILDNDWDRYADRMTELAWTEKFKPYKHLITFLLADETKPNKAMRRLISQEYNGSSISTEFVSPLVRTGTTPGLIHSLDRVADFLHSLKRELTGLLYKDVKGLVDSLLNSAHLDPALRLEPDENFINKMHAKIIIDKTETSMLDWIGSFDKQFKTQFPGKNLRTWQSKPQIALGGINSKCKLDGAIMSRDFEEQHSNHIRDVMVPFELKSNDSRTTAALEHLAKYVYEVFTNQPTQSFVIGITMCGTSLQLWQFDRSGAIGSELIDVKANKENLKKFGDLMFWFLTCNKTLLGFDPTIVEEEGHPVAINTCNQRFLIQPSPIFRAPGICGRGTTCWKAYLSGDESDNFIIKDSWQVENRRNEGEMLREVTEKDVHYVARYYAHEDVFVHGTIVDIESHVRRGAEYKGGKKIRFDVKPEDPQVKNECTNRFHRRMILKDVGVPIYEVDSPARLLEAFEDCIKGHQELLKAGYLHRDISINNLMVNNNSKDPYQKSFLIDLDMAIPSSSGAQCSLARTGTKVFMSCHLLLGRPGHTHVDDLESLFWVMTWICIQYPAKERKETTLPTWNQMSLEFLGIHKKGLLEEPFRLTKHFTPRFQSLTQCVHDFAKIMYKEIGRSVDSVRRDDPAKLYNKILPLFQRVREELSQRV
ncbi:hypothetical protein PTTG_26385 [Puccinia triticina 1-1 BBBD Race 1]|uniref:Non-specific serine/threonine protein kinase n=1 Tax=Puccinia triticina (isolate 1-1 / race 1 (BBBD)) TaxID=630390 RepID=A0A180GUE1_PUCT1|nr:hypothetical protein PTTG_26385 [Puccinia triticina 1-1 BBBD Race 1]